MGGISTWAVALRKESVDRNSLSTMFSIRRCLVALRKESVDRNLNCPRSTTRTPTVALRKESVDRNLVKDYLGAVVQGSLSARRAWIEIVTRSDLRGSGSGVALRKESVDRNGHCGVPPL